MNGQSQLIIAAICSFTASFLHLAIVFGGPDWYRFFGAGEQMAKMAEMGSKQPMITTLVIATILAIWGLYALSAAGVIMRLPLLKTVLVLISLIYLVRGLAGLILPFVTSHPAIAQNSVTFWMVSSVICTSFGAFYLLGTLNRWSELA